MLTNSIAKKILFIYALYLVTAWIKNFYSRTFSRIFVHKFLMFFYHLFWLNLDFSLFIWRDSEVGFWGWICRLPEWPFWLYARLLYSSTQPYSESFTHLKTGWAQDARLQWSYENWHFYLDISRWPNIDLLMNNMDNYLR